MVKKEINTRFFLFSSFSLELLLLKLKFFASSIG